MNKLVFIRVSCFLAIACSRSTIPATVATPGSSPNAGILNIIRRPASLGIVGDSANVNKSVNGGIVLMGGGTDVQAALNWMIVQ